MMIFQLLGGKQVQPQEWLVHKVGHELEGPTEEFMTQALGTPVTWAITADRIQLEEDSWNGYVEPPSYMRTKSQFQPTAWRV